MDLNLTPVENDLKLFDPSNMMQPKASRLTNIQGLLQKLIESAQQSWTYSIFWSVSLSGKGPSIVLRDWFYNYDINGEEFTDIFVLKWFPFSRDDSFAEGSGLPLHAWQNSCPIWITGFTNLLGVICTRPIKAAILYGLNTMVYIPSEIGVIELGSMALNYQSMDLVNKAVQLLNSIHMSKMFWPVQPGDESESSNSIGNNSTVRSNAHLSDENEEWTLGLHLGYKAWLVKPQYEARCSSSSSSVGYYPVPMVKEKQKPQFSGKLQVGSDNHSANSSDINAFVQILKGRQG